MIFIEAGLGRTVLGSISCRTLDSYSKEFRFGIVCRFTSFVAVT
jgi:hypothetical protein